MSSLLSKGIIEWKPVGYDNFNDKPLTRTEYLTNMKLTEDNIHAVFGTNMNKDRMLCISKDDSVGENIKKKIYELYGSEFGE
ncbi:MAG: hypothetical protein LBJ20_07230 [Candidatus Methanoplasma sp.]|nr:hypothetical protein [Candidatus Methanoplasma sp.]